MTAELVVASVTAALFAALTLANCLSNRPAQAASDWVRITAWAFSMAIVGFFVALIAMIPA